MKTQAHKPAEKTMQILALRGCVGWRFYYLLPTAQWHSQAHKPATATSDSDLRISWPQAMTAWPQKRFMLIQFAWFEFCELDGSCLAWMRSKNFWTVSATRVVSCKCIQKDSHITDCTLPNQTMKIKLLSIPIKTNLFENWNLQTPWMLEGSVRELRILITYIPKPGYVSWSCQPLGLKNEKKIPSIWPYTALQQRWAPSHDMPRSSTWAAIVTPCFSIASIFVGFFLQAS